MFASSWHVYRVDPSGNLRSFDLKVMPGGSNDSLLTVQGRLKDRSRWRCLHKGPVPVLNRELISL